MTMCRLWRCLATGSSWRSNSLARATRTTRVGTNTSKCGQMALAPSPLLTSLFQSTLNRLACSTGKHCTQHSAEDSFVVCRCMEERQVCVRQPDLQSLRHCASIELLMCKSIACHYEVQPRSCSKGTGVITVTEHCCEPTWEVGFHRVVCASSCMWPKNTVRTHGKPPWHNIGEGSNSTNPWPVYEYEFRTAISIARILPLDRLLVEIEPPKSKCPLPLYFTPAITTPRWIQHADQPSGVPERVKQGDAAFRHS
jgi:hypothetical protein